MTETPDRTFIRYGQTAADIGGAVGCLHLATMIRGADVEQAAIAIEAFRRATIEKAQAG